MEVRNIVLVTVLCVRATLFVMVCAHASVVCGMMWHASVRNFHNLQQHLQQLTCTATHAGGASAVLL